MANLYQFPSPNLTTWAGTAGYTVCVAVTGSSPAAMLERAESLLAGQSFLELRLDSVPDPTRRRACPPTQQERGLPGNKARRLKLKQAALNLPNIHDLLRA
jgi:hypothetical protein